MRRARPGFKASNCPAESNDDFLWTGGETEAQVAEPTRPRAHTVRPSGVGI